MGCFFFAALLAAMRRLGFAAAALLLAALPAAAAEKNAAAHIGAGVGSGAPAKVTPDTDAQRRLIERGRYLALASDCEACHTARGAGGGAFAGGYSFKLPMGVIVSSNITPSVKYGIGGWSEAEFARAAREGVRPGGGRLYPAMPYPEYSIMTDEDMRALYAYLTQAVPAVDAAPRQKTKMHFPFSARAGMIAWNALFLNYRRYAPEPNVSGLINRGRFLVDGPAHCGTCHTPRNFMMAPDKSRYLAGSELGGWWAPNITSDPVSGLGGWSEAEIAAFLQNGHVRDKSQANGPMAEAVEYSFRYMTEGDLRAIAAYLKTVPPLADPQQKEPAFTPHRPINSSFAQYEMPFGGASSAYASEAGSLDGALLYNTACASCHGANGEGAADASSPSLLANRAVGSVNPGALIMTVARGLYRRGADETVSMPGFLEGDTPIYAAMNPAQIAAIVNYARENFGGFAGREEKVTADDVQTALAGGKLPFLLAHAALFLLLGIISAFAVLAILLWRFLLRGRLLQSRTRRKRAPQPALKAPRRARKTKKAAVADKTGNNKAAAAAVKKGAARVKATVKAAAKQTRQKRTAAKKHK